ncbi:GNAT family N-acetyltransferase [Mobiluncus porci]|uniref:N-acetyltransferase n=1 Tax=Mobiluncus porci TaxID=2652278 RepID=A0A7K0K1I5_9ACTO|nr:N-acetyltransferase [Mobiluncus porci]MST49356.1 N-acetyltransferase [Mobiluncus porci]
MYKRKSEIGREVDLAGVLVEQALVESARTGKTVVPVCPVVRGWLDKHDYEGTWRHPTQADIDWLRAQLGSGI